MGNCLSHAPSVLSSSGADGSSEVPACQHCAASESCTYRELRPEVKKLWHQGKAEGGAVLWTCRKCTLTVKLSSRQQKVEEEHRQRIDEVIKKSKEKEKKEKLANAPDELHTIHSGDEWKDTESFRESVKLAPKTKRKVRKAQAKRVGQRLANVAEMDAHAVDEASFDFGSEGGGGGGGLPHGSGAGQGAEGSCYDDDRTAVVSGYGGGAGAGDEGEGWDAASESSSAPASWAEWAGNNGGGAPGAAAGAASGAAEGSSMNGSLEGGWEGGLKGGLEGVPDDKVPTRPPSSRDHGRPSPAHPAGEKSAAAEEGGGGGGGGSGGGGLDGIVLVQGPGEESGATSPPGLGLRSLFAQSLREEKDHRSSAAAV